MMYKSSPVTAMAEREADWTMNTIPSRVENPKCNRLESLVIFWDGRNGGEASGANCRQFILATIDASYVRSPGLLSTFLVYRSEWTAL